MIKLKAFLLSLVLVIATLALLNVTYVKKIEDYYKVKDNSIRYSYAYLFKTERQPQDRIFNNRQVQIRDFYNQALAKL